MSPASSRALRTAAVVLPLLMVLGVVGVLAFTGEGEVAGARVEQLDRGTPEETLLPSVPTPTIVPAPSPAAAEPCVPVPPTPLRVVSFNIRSARGPAGVDLDRVVAELRAVNPDIVLMQEVDRFRARSGGVDQAAYVAKALDMRHVFAPMVARSAAAGGRREEYGIATLTRLPLTTHRVTRLPRPARTEARGLLHVQLEVDGRTVSVYNTHLEHSSTAARSAQVATISRVLGADPNPVVLGGDLNAVPGSAVHRQLTRTLRDTWDVAGQGSGLTVPARSPRRRIDYVLVDREFTPTAATTHPTAVSDHRLLRSDLMLAPGTCEA